MHILYIDDSGHVENTNEKHFVLGGIAVFERGIYHALEAAEKCVADFGLGPPEDIELHGSPMYSGRDGIWRSIKDRSKREMMIKGALSTLMNSASIRLF